MSRLLRRAAVTAVCAALLVSVPACSKNDGGSASQDPVTSESDTDEPDSDESDSDESGDDATAASHDSPAGAMRGLLDAMSAGETSGILEWISPDPPADRRSVTSTERLASLGSGRVFWLVDERQVVKVAKTSDDAADVELDGYLVWCMGEGPDDEDASCAQPNGTGDTQTTTYPAVRVDGQWYVHLDLNRGELIRDNPGPKGVAA